MVSGHSFLLNDSDFGSIEIYTKNKHINVADDWYKIISKCRRNKPFHVSKMYQQDFKSTKNLQNMVKKKYR